MSRSRSSSVNEDKISFISPDNVPSRPILYGDIGRGFNILNGEPKEFLFQNLRVQCTSEKGENEKDYHFKDSPEFIREVVSRVGLSSVEKGMFSMISSQSKYPFLCEIDNTVGSQHFFMEIERKSYGLSIDATSHVSKLLKDEEKRLKENPFSKQTKNIYYSFIEKFGTHYVKQATFGHKAEMRWSIRMKSDNDAFSKITKSQQQKQRFEDSFKVWKQINFDTVGEGYKKVKKNIPKNTSVQMKVTPGFTNFNPNSNSVQIKFSLTPIQNLFDASVRKDLEVAVRLYLEEMRPKVDADDFQDDQIVGLYCVDSSTWVRVDDHGHLYSDSSQLGPENKFEVRRKGNKIGFKSLKFQNKYLSKALMRSIFHFHRLQYMGPYESFEVNGDYLIVGSNISDNSGFLAVADDQQIHVSDSKKTRILVLNIEIRSSTRIAPEDVKEPQYVEDESLILSEISDVPPSLKDIPKANSTSSLFIKDTIILPNIDELTRCMALYLSVLIKEGHTASKLHILDIFNEDIYPLTKNVPKLQYMKIPPVETIFHFLNTIFKVEKLSPEPGIMALVYIERIIDKTHMHLHAASWRRLVLAALIIASKVWEDQSVWTVDFLELFPSANIKDLNRLEQNLLAILEFNVSIKASDYVKHYFELRAYMKSDFSQRGGKPLDHEALHKLEIRSASSEEDFKAPFKMLKSATSTQLVDKNKKHGLGVLS